MVAVRAVRQRKASDGLLSLEESVAGSNRTRIEMRQTSDTAKAED
jgi:hypothetical protein